MLVKSSWAWTKSSLTFSLLNRRTEVEAARFLCPIRGACTVLYVCMYVCQPKNAMAKREDHTFG